MTQGRMIYEIEVQGENGPEFIEFEGPDGLTDQQIESLAADQLRTARPGQTFPAAQFAGESDRRLPDWAYQAAPYASAMGEFYLDQGIGAAQGAAGVLDNAAELAQGAYNNTLGRVFGQSDSATQANQTGQGFSGIVDRLGPGGEVGRLAGQIGASALLTRGLPGPITQGAGAGALMSEADSPGELVRDMAIGGAGGQAGSLVARGVQRVLGPVVDQSARILNQAGVRITPGQHLPALREFEDKAMSWPFIGPNLQAARRQGFEDFAVAVPRQALETVQRRLPGRTIPAIPEGATGQAAVRHTGDQLSAVYNDIVPRMSLRADDELITALRAVPDTVRTEGISEAGEATLDRLIQRGIVGRFRSGPVVSGQQYDKADTWLGRQIARFGKNDSDPDNQLIAGALQDIRAELRNAVSRQNGQLGQELEAVDEAWSMLVPAEQAAAGVSRGYFSPAQYRRALAKGDSRVRRRGMARGEVRGQEFAEAGIDVLPSEFPNPSGTSSHEAYNLGNLRLWQGAAANMLYGQPTRNALNALTIGRPAALDPIAQAVARGFNLLPAPQAGAAGAVSGTNALLGF